jgi:hypothetical protein
VGVYRNPFTLLNLAMGGGLRVSTSGLSKYRTYLGRLHSLVRASITSASHKNKPKSSAGDAPERRPVQSCESLRFTYLPLFSTAATCLHKASGPSTLLRKTSAMWQPGGISLTPEISRMGTSGFMAFSCSAS